MFFQTSHKNWFSTSTTPEGQDGAEVAPGLWVGSLQFAQDSSSLSLEFLGPKDVNQQAVMVVLKLFVDVSKFLLFVCFALLDLCFLGDCYHQT